MYRITSSELNTLGKLDVCCIWAHLPCNVGMVVCMCLIFTTLAGIRMFMDCGLLCSAQTLKCLFKYTVLSALLRGTACGRTQPPL